MPITFHVFNSHCVVAVSIFDHALIVLRSCTALYFWLLLFNISTIWKFENFGDDDTRVFKFDYVYNVSGSYLSDFVAGALKDDCTVDADCQCAAGTFPHCHHGKCYCHHSTHECHHPDECAACDVDHFPTCDHHLCHCHPTTPH